MIRLFILFIFINSLYGGPISFNINQPLIQSLNPIRVKFDYVEDDNVQKICDILSRFSIL